MKKFGIDMASLTDIGKVREKNEDAVLTSEKLSLLAVADGMGGHNAGEVASRMAVETLESVITDINKGLIEVPNNLGQNLSELEQKLLFAGSISNLSVFKSSKVNVSKRGMGTTLSAILVERNHAVAIHVGDSRIYLFRNNDFVQVTTDHCLATEHVELGLLKTNYDLSDSRIQNILTKAVGLKKDIEMDVFRIFPEDGDLFLLCSDGLNKEMKDEEIKEILKESKEKNSAEICQTLVDLALSRGGQDNISVIIMKIAGSKREAGLGELFKFFKKSKT